MILPLISTWFDAASRAFTHNQRTDYATKNLMQALCSEC
ncbi:hypothetical protein bAD24_III06155 [Burkholderia sp. AD24]|nr:hypothetical protein bAD24_III06155 [Burkholderia sp. AD24]